MTFPVGLLSFDALAIEHQAQDVAFPAWKLGMIGEQDGCSMLEETSLVYDQDRISGGQVLDNMPPHHVAQRVRIPPAAIQDGLLPSWASVASSLRAHPNSLGPLVTQQAIKKRIGRRRHTLLSEQGTYPPFDVAQRRRPQLKCRLDQCTRHP